MTILRDILENDRGGIVPLSTHKMGGGKCLYPAMTGEERKGNSLCDYMISNKIDRQRAQSDESIPQGFRVDRVCSTSRVNFLHVNQTEVAQSLSRCGSDPATS